MEVKLHQLATPFKTFKLNLSKESTIKVYDKVLLNEEERSVKQLRSNDWIIIMGKKYCVEEIYDVPEITESHPEGLH